GGHDEAREYGAEVNREPGIGADAEEGEGDEQCRRHHRARHDDADAQARSGLDCQSDFTCYALEHGQSQSSIGEISSSPRYRNGGLVNPLAAANNTKNIAAYLPKPALSDANS